MKDTAIAKIDEMADRMDRMMMLTADAYANGNRETYDPVAAEADYSSLDRFKKAKALVVLCQSGGWGVLEFVGHGNGAPDGLRRHGYSHDEKARGWPMRGTLTRNEADRLAEKLNERV